MMQLINRFLLTVCLSGVCIVAGMVVHYWDKFTLNLDISFFDIFSLVAVSGIVFYVTNRLEKSEAADRCEKEIIIGCLDLISEKTSDLRSHVRLGSIKFNDVNEMIYEIQCINSRAEAQINTDYKILYDKIDEKIETLINSLDELLTGDTAENVSLSLDSDETICNYTDDAIMNSEMFFEQIDDAIFKYKILLNKI